MFEFPPPQRSTRRGLSVSAPLEPRRLPGGLSCDKDRWPRPPAGADLVRLRAWSREREKALADPRVRAARRNAANPGRRVTTKAVPPGVLAALTLCADVAARIAAVLHYGSTNRPLDLVAPESFTGIAAASERLEAAGQAAVAAWRAGFRGLDPYFDENPGALTCLLQGLVAERYGVGNCGQRADLAVAELVEEAEPGAEVLRAATPGSDHGFVLYRAKPGQPLVVCDPWLPQEQACLAEDYHRFPEGCGDPFQLPYNVRPVVRVRVDVTPESKAAFADMSTRMRVHLAEAPTPPPVDPHPRDWSGDLLAQVEANIGTDIRTHRDPGVALRYVAEAGTGRQ